MAKYTCASLIILSFISCFSCKKKADDNGSYFENKNAYSIYIDIYDPSKGNGRVNFYDKLIIHEEVKPNGRLDLTKYNLHGAPSFIYDWYSPDYRHSNWMNRPTDAGDHETFRYNPGVKIYISSKEKGSSERMVCLSGNGKSTKWQTVDAYDLTGKSVWHELGSEKYHSIEIKKYWSIIDSNWEGVPFCGPVGLQAVFGLTDTNRFWLSTENAPDEDPNLILTDNTDFIVPLSTASTDTLFYITLTKDFVTGIVQKQPKVIYKVAKVKTLY